jgi:hypothetical protein
VRLSQIRWWREQMRASRLVGREDYIGAGNIYARLVAADGSDFWAVIMLSLCYERQGRVREALALAETGVRQLPSSLYAVQAAVRLAVAADEHEKAAAYVRQGLALPEVRTEIPQEGRIPQPFLGLLRVLAHVPVLRNRLRKDELRMFEPGVQAVALGEWKRWARDYLAWSEGKESPDEPELVH